MSAPGLRAAVAASVLAAGVPAPAQTQPPQACELPTSSLGALLDRAGLLAQYERLPAPCLRELFAACNQAAGDGLLDFGSAAACSFGYEALLSQHFGGDFHALLAWWAAQQRPARP